MLRKKREMLRDCKGQGLIEYVLIAAVIAVALIVAMGLLKEKISTKFASTGTEITQAR
ncbi:MAG: Flp family type IVb pilin [Candidatus Omnitrophica bacterium]|nr:Flp family type IVb pilin [Candidatus Omnitrophota bacterium]